MTIELLREPIRRQLKTITGCASHFENLANFKIVKELLLVLKQTIQQKKDLDLSFNLAPWRAWHYHEAVTPSCPKMTFFTPRAHMLFAASRRGALLMMPPPFQGAKSKLRSRAFCWGIICFCTTIALVLSDNAGENFSKKIISAIS